MNDYSRDETEFGSFGDAYVPSSLTALPMFGGFFSNILKKVVKKPVQAKVSAGLRAQGATQAQVDAYNRAAAKAQPTAKDVASGVAKSAIMLAPIVATAGGAGLLAAPAFAAAAPFAKSIASTAAPVVRGAAPLVASAKPLVSSALHAAPSVNPALIAAAAAAGHISVDAAKKMIAGQAAMAAAPAPARAPAPAPAKPAPARAPAPAPAPQPAMTPGGIAALTNTLSNLVRQGASIPKLQGVLDQAKAKLPPTSEGQAAAAKAQATFDAAKATPRYLVLDSGQVLSGQNAQQKLPGFAVRVDGIVARQ